VVCGSTCLTTSQCGVVDLTNVSQFIIFADRPTNSFTSRVYVELVKRSGQPLYPSLVILMCLFGPVGTNYQLIIIIIEMMKCMNLVTKLFRKKKCMFHFKFFFLNVLFLVDKCQHL
jgi:hypothetical protein